MLKEVFESLPWSWNSADDGRKSVLLLDEGVTELITWHDARYGLSLTIPEKVTAVLDLELSTKNMEYLQTVKPHRVLFWCNILEEQGLAAMQALLTASEAAECLILTNTSIPALQMYFPSVPEVSYENIGDLFAPVHCQVLYFPYYSVPLLQPAGCKVGENLLELRILSYHEGRELQPITLHNLGEMSTSSSEYQRFSVFKMFFSLIMSASE